MDVLHNLAFGFEHALTLLSTIVSVRENTAIVEQLVHEAEQQFQDAPIQAYVPILVEHIVRQQIRLNTSTT